MASRRSTKALLAALPAIAAFVAACSADTGPEDGLPGESEGVDDPALNPGDPETARVTLDRLGERFRVGSRAAIPEGADVAFAAVADGYEARLVTRSLLRVRLPLDASQPAAVQTGSGVGVAFVLEGAQAVAPSFADGIAVYAGAAPGGGDLLHRVTGSSVEDFLVFESTPAQESVTYTVDVSTAAGLRLVGGFLEFLDASGTPRVRMNEPYVIDADGVRHTASVSIEGCAVDTSPLAPWGRAVTDPGSQFCSVVVSWDEARLTYPALLDPAWTDTANAMGAERKGHTATKLSNGQVLIAGGERPATPNTEYLATTELFDPSTDTFAAGPALVAGRSFHVAVLRDDGSVVIAGGMDGSGDLATSEVYPDPLGVDADFVAGPTMTTARREAKAQLITTGGIGDVLIVGGVGGSAVLSTSERLVAGAGWDIDRTMSANRRGHELVRLNTGQVMTIAGITTLSITDLYTSELYSSSTNAWQVLAGQLTTARYFHAGDVLQPDGRVLIAGGYSYSFGDNTNSAEIFNPSTGQWAGVGSLAQARQYHTLTALDSGGALVVGGAWTTNGVVIQSGTYLSTSEIFNPQTNSWSTGPSLTEARAFHTATLLDDGRVLVAGGEGALGVLASAQLFGLDADGTACSSASTCASGFCVEGVCCSAACDTLCVSCLTAMTGGPDGTCLGVTVGTDPEDECDDSGGSVCGNNGLCNGTGACQTYSSSPCTANPCTTGTECASGSCVDGVCCDQICSSPCEACTAAKKGYGTDGVCDYIVEGTDPDSECAAMGTGACAGDGACNGSGSCQSGLTGQVCAQSGCINEVTVGYEATCTTLGECNQSTDDCGQYACDAATLSCRYSCTTNAHCSPGVQCISGQCVPNPSGTACIGGAECQSGYCVDGVCCTSSCTGQCEACDVAGSQGQCIAVSGAPHGSRQACGGTGECAGRCDGSSSYCMFPDATIACGDTTCDQEIEFAETCNGSGNCVAQTGRSCYPYTCGDVACLTECTTDADCAAGSRCDASNTCVGSGSALCVDDGTIEDPSGTTRECLPYACRGGSCLGSCVTSEDCSGGNVCYTQAGTCGRRRDDGCGCRAVGTAPAGGAGTTLGLVIGLALFWRRRGIRG